MTNLHDAVIDSRDIIERIEELEAMKESMQKDVDEDATAANLKSDYVELDFDGQTYYMRGS